MELTVYNVFQGLAYITLVVAASYVSWKKGEKEGSVFMLDYLRENKFMNDTDYANFMRHVRSERNSMGVEEVSPTKLKKNDKEKEKDISNNSE